MKCVRVIKAHVKETNIKVYPLLHAFEKSLLSIKDADGLPFFAKGASFEQRAVIVAEKARNRIVYSLDMSSFDNSVRGALYLGELRAFSEIFGCWFDEKDFVKPIL